MQCGAGALSETHMPRRLRVHVPGGFYHVTLRGNHRRAIFIEEGDQRVLNAIVARALANYDFRLHAYCWMTNHIHLLLQAGSNPISHPMRDIAAEFARVMQRKLATTGHFFERRFFASLVDADSYFLELLRYIHLNPVRAGLVATAGDYPWSSHHTYVGVRHEPWVTTAFALEMFSVDSLKGIATYLEFVGSKDAAEWSPDKLVSIQDERERKHQGFVPEFTTPRPSRQSLEQLIAEACARFEVAPDALISTVRNRYITKVRAWIAYQARVRQICPLSEVARALDRHEATLREAIRRYPHEMA
jgi:putative transposase